MIRILFSLRRFASLSAVTLAAVAVVGCGNDETMGSAPVPPLAVTSGALAAGTVGASYDQPVVVGGGTAPYACTESGLTAGLKLQPSCSVTGTPTTVGTYTFPVAATDASSPQRSGTGSVSVTVGPAPLKLTLPTPPIFPTGEVTVSYSASLNVTGGTSPYTCTATGLPAGLSMNTNCTVTGIPTVAGTFSSILVNVTDSGSPQQAASGTMGMTVVTGSTTRVLAGSDPIVGASVQIYAAGTTGLGSAPLALLGTPLTTDPTGGFTIPPTGFTCPTATSIVYLVATGGKTATGGTNAGTRLMSSPGACSTLAGLKTFVINEATTVASVYSFAQFMSAGGNIGATATNLSGITLASGTLHNLIDTSAATMPGPNFPTATATMPVTKINLLALLLNSCIESTGSSSAACTGLYSGATIGGTMPSNTLDAVLNLVKNPATGVSSLYALASLASGSNPYAPLPDTQPSDWTLFLSYMGGGMNDPTALSIDSAGRVWVANYFSVASLFTNTGVPVISGGVVGNSLLNSYGGAVDATDNFWAANEGNASITVIGPTGTPVSGSPYTSGGLNFPISVAFDTAGYGWIVDYGNSHLSILSSSGASAAGSAGYTTSQFIFPVAVAVDSNHTGWVANQSSNTVTSISFDGATVKSYVVGSGPSGVAVDKSNNVWTSNYYGDSIGLVSSAGVVKSGTTGFTGGGVVHPQGIATDGAGSVWITNYRGPSISELAGATTANPGAAISPAAGWAPDAAMLEAFGIAIDASGNVWVTNFGNNTLTEFVGMAVPVKTPLIGVPVVP